MAYDSSIFQNCIPKHLQSVAHNINCAVHCYSPPAKLWEGNVFTGVCHSVHGGRISVVPGSFLVPYPF